MAKTVERLHIEIPQGLREVNANSNRGNPKRVVESNFNMGRHGTSNNFDPPTANSERNSDAIEEKYGGDLISRLPDDTLCRIISFLLWRDAVTTSLLSTRWRGLWKKTLPTTQKQGPQEEICQEIGYFLDDVHQHGLFGYRHGRFVRECYRLMRSDRRQLKNFRRLQFNFSHGSFLLATIEPVGTLHLDFHTEKNGRNESPSEIAWHLHLKEGPSYGSYDFPASVPSSIFIRTIHLISVGSLTSETLSSILSNFPCLRTLIIKDCPGLHSFHIDDKRCLPELMISNCSQLKSVHFKGKISKFWIRGVLPMFISECDDLDMEDVLLDVRGGPTDHFKYEDSESLLSSIRVVHTLTLCRWTFEAVIRPWLTPSSTLSRLEELQWIDNSVEKYKIDALFSFLKICPYLKKLYITIDPTSYSGLSTSEHITNVPQRRRLDYLKFIRLEGVINEEDKISLAERFVELDKWKPPLFVAKSQENHLYKWVKVQKPILSGEEEKRYHYQFVKVEEGCSGLACSRRAAFMDL